MTDVSELQQFRLPDVGRGADRGGHRQLAGQPGDTVTVNQIIVEIETAKAVVELPSPYEGVVAGLLVPEGETVDVGHADHRGGRARRRRSRERPPPRHGRRPPAPAADPRPGAGRAAADPAAIAAAGPRPLV